MTKQYSFPREKIRILLLEHEHYLRLTSAGTKPNLAKLTIARRVAAIVLRMWKDEKEYAPSKLEQQERLASAVS